MVGARTPRRGTRREDSSRKKDEQGEEGLWRGGDGEGRNENGTWRKMGRGGRSRGGKEEACSRRGSLQGSFRNARREQNCRERERERERGYGKTGSLDYFSFFSLLLLFFSFALLPFPPSHLILPPLSSFSLFLLFTREATIPGEKCRGKGRGREREREKKEESRGSRVVCPRYRRARLKGTHGRMVHMDLEMFAGRAVQILIKRNIFRMRAPTGTGETKRRVPFLILSRHAWKNASPSIPTPSGSMTFGFALYPFPVSFHLPSDLSIVIRSVDSL